MNLGIVLAFFCIILGISFAFDSDIVGLFAFISLGISLVLMEDIGNDNLLVFINPQGVLSAKVVFAWATLLFFIIMFSYKVFREHNMYH